MASGLLNFQSPFPFTLGSLTIVSHKAVRLNLFYYIQQLCHNNIYATEREKEKCRYCFPAPKLQQNEVVLLSSVNTFSFDFWFPRSGHIEQILPWL